MKKNAFTLIELAIVLTIVSFIAGGVFVGQSLVVNSQLRGVMMEQARLTKSATMFRDKYYTLPGDMSNAEAMWGTASGVCPWGARSGTQTCNGNNNGKVQPETDTRELFTFWQHMSIAGTMEEATNGISPDPDYGFSPGVSVPKSVWSEAAGWNVRFVGAIAAEGTYYVGNYGHIYMLGSVGFDSTANGVMQPARQLELDRKFDDGLPHTGNLRSARNTYVGACITGNTYNIATTDNVCAPIWITGF